MMDWIACSILWNCYNNFSAIYSGGFSVHTNTQRRNIFHFVCICRSLIVAGILQRNQAGTLSQDRVADILGAALVGTLAGDDRHLSLIHISYIFF